MRQFGCKGVFLPVLGESELCRHAIGTALHEVLDFFLAFDDEAHGHALHATGRKCGFHFLPKQWRQLITHQTVEHASGLLRIDEAHVDVARVLDGVGDGRFGDFVEDDALRVFLLQVEHFIEMPRDGFSLAVLIGCEPHRVGCLREFPQLGHKVFLVVRYLVFGFKVLFDVDAQSVLAQVAHVSLTCFHRKILAQETLDGLGFGR